MDSNTSPVADFYRDRSILITGGSGFVGKVLVEKLLRSCHAVKTIYLLLRPKRGQEPRQRLEELLKTKLFDRVKKERPTSVSKLVPIHGDLTLPDLGLSASDQSVLRSSVSVVFHSAATIKFNERLKKAIDMNVLGTRRLVKLCHTMTHLEAFIHISTAYSNCDGKEIEEVVYEPLIPPQKIIDTIEWMDEDAVQDLTPHLIGGRPNTYTYTKALTENLLVEEGGTLPISIIRPSIVTASWKEPFPGWIDNFNGPTGFIAASGAGLLRSMHCQPSFISDLIPVDTVVNLAITVAWNTASHITNRIMVYNCISGSTNKLTWDMAQPLAMKLMLQHPSSQVFFYPNCSLVKSKFWNNASVFLFQHIPAYLIDMVALLTGQKPKFVALYRKIHRGINVLEYFSTHEWTFKCDNVTMLLDKISKEDRQEFNFDIKTLHWPTYIENYILGVRKFLLKEEPSSLPSARKNLKRLYIYTKLTQLLMVLLIGKLVVMRYSGARKLWNVVLLSMIELYNFAQANLKLLNSIISVK